MVAINQFAQTPVQGMMDLEFNGSVWTGQVSNSQGTALIAGQTVKLDPTAASGVPKYLARTAATDPIDGVVARNLKNPSFVAADYFEVAASDSVIYLTADAAINRGIPVEEVLGSPGHVIPWAGVNPVLGWAFGNASAATDLVRIYILAPNNKPQYQQSGSDQVQSAVVTATLAQINAGLVLIPGVAGQQIDVVGVVAKVLGNFATGTSVELESDATTVAVETIAEAALTTGAVLFPTSANVTLGAGFAAPLPAGEGLKVANNGAPQTAGTSIAFTIQYTQK